MKVFFCNMCGASCEAPGYLPVGETHEVSCTSCNCNSGCVYEDYLFATKSGEEVTLSGSSAYYGGVAKHVSADVAERIRNLADMATIAENNGCDGAEAAVAANKAAELLAAATSWPVIRLKY